MTADRDGGGKGPFMLRTGVRRRPGGLALHRAGRQAHDYRLKPAPLNATFHYYARLALEGAPECLDEDA